VKRYRVLLAIEVDGRIYEFGETVELDAKTAWEYRHALMVACEDAGQEACGTKEEDSGGDS
jgi:hypothetical protein